MKNITLLFAFMFTLMANAQINLETVYANANRKLYMVNLEVSGMKYVVKSDVPNNRFIKLYNLNHSLWKTIDCNSMPTVSMQISQQPIVQYNFDAICISEKVFDCDDGIEFMYVSDLGNICATRIYKENGTAILIADSMGPFVKLNVPNQYKPLYNTPTGAKLILSHLNGSAKVYSLPCSISNTVSLFDNSLIQDDKFGMNVFPNPSVYESTITYKLPNGVNSGEIIIYDLTGKQIKSYAVDNTFSSILIPQADMASGTYIYSLKANGQIIDSKKIVLSGK